MQFPIKKKQINLGIIGMSEGNGHPYSWSAIFNGYDSNLLKNTRYPNIAEYLDKQPKDTFGIEEAKVTHIYCDKKADARSVQRCSNIPNICDSIEDLSNNVDAVIVATDIGSEHVKLCQGLVEKGIPFFVDKPLTDNMDDLNTFNNWKLNGTKFLSSSSMRFAKELIPYYLSTHNLGKIRYISALSNKKWETYGIHCLEAIYPLLCPGFLTIQNTGTYERNVVHLTHKSGCDINIIVSSDMSAGFGLINIVGTDGIAQLQIKDMFYGFKKQLESFIEYLRTGVEPIPYEHTQELIRLLICGLESRVDNGKKIYI